MAWCYFLTQKPTMAKTPAIVAHNSFPFHSPMMEAALLRATVAASAPQSAEEVAAAGDSSSCDVSSSTSRRRQRTTLRVAQKHPAASAAAVVSAQHKQQLSTQAGQAIGCSIIHCCWLAACTRWSCLNHHSKQSLATASEVSAAAPTPCHS
jgi:hypothetical protein